MNRRIINRIRMDEETAIRCVDSIVEPNDFIYFAEHYVSELQSYKLVQAILASDLCRGEVLISVIEALHTSLIGEETCTRVFLECLAHPKVTFEVVSLATFDDIPEIRHAALRHPLANPGIVRTLLAGGYVEDLRQVALVAGSDKLGGTDILGVLSRHKDSEVRRNVAHNCYTPKSVLLELESDMDLSVAAVAKERNPSYFKVGDPLI